MSGLSNANQTSCHSGSKQSLLPALSEVAAGSCRLSEWVQVWQSGEEHASNMGDYSIGVDLGGTNLRIAAVDSDGKLMEKLTLGAEVSRGREFVITEMCKAIEALADEVQGLR